MEENAVFEWVQPVIQLVTAGGFGALVWYMVVKHIPSIETRHKEERLEWLQYIEKRDAKLESLTQSFVTLIGSVNQSMNSLEHRVEQMEQMLRSRS